VFINLNVIRTTTSNCRYFVARSVPVAGIDKAGECARKKAWLYGMVLRLGVTDWCCE
jgi:hypothetical protein